LKKNEKIIYQKVGLFFAKKIVPLKNLKIKLYENN